MSQVLDTLVAEIQTSDLKVLWTIFIWLLFPFYDSQYTPSKIDMPLSYFWKARWWWWCHGFESCWELRPKVLIFTDMPCGFIKLQLNCLANNAHCYIWIKKGRCLHAWKHHLSCEARLWQHGALWVFCSPTRRNWCTLRSSLCHKQMTLWSKMKVASKKRSKWWPKWTTTLRIANYLQSGWRTTK